MSSSTASFLSQITSNNNSSNNNANGDDDDDRDASNETTFDNITSSTMSPSTTTADENKTPTAAAAAIAPSTTTAATTPASFANIAPLLTLLTQSNDVTTAAAAAAAAAGLLEKQGATVMPSLAAAIGNGAIKAPQSTPTQQPSPVASLATSAAAMPQSSLTAGSNATNNMSQFLAAHSSLFPTATAFGTTTGSPTGGGVVTAPSPFATMTASPYPMMGMMANFSAVDLRNFLESQVQQKHQKQQQQQQQQQHTQTPAITPKIPPPTSSAPPPPTTTTTPKKVKFSTRDEIRQWCLSYYTSTLSLRAFCNERGLESKRRTISRNFNDGGLTVLKEQGAPIEVAEKAMDEHLNRKEGRGRGKKQKTEDGAVESLTQQPPLATGDGSLPPPTTSTTLSLPPTPPPAPSLPPPTPSSSTLPPRGRKKGDSIKHCSPDDIRKWCLEYYTSTLSLRSFCNRNDLASKRRTISRNFKDSGLLRLKKANAEFGEAELALEKHLKMKMEGGRRRSGGGVDKKVETLPPPRPPPLPSNDAVLRRAAWDERERWIKSSYDGYVRSGVGSFDSFRQFCRRLERPFEVTLEDGTQARVKGYVGVGGEEEGVALNDGMVILKRKEEGGEGNGGGAAAAGGGNIAAPGVGAGVPMMSSLEVESPGEGMDTGADKSGLI